MFYHFLRSMSTLPASLSSRPATLNEVSLHNRTPSLHVESLSSTRAAWVPPRTCRVKFLCNYIKLLSSDSCPRLGVTLGGGIDAVIGSPPSWRALAPGEAPALHEIVAFAPPVGSALDTLMHALTTNAERFASETAAIASLAPAARAARATARTLALVEGLFTRVSSHLTDDKAPPLSSVAGAPSGSDAVATLGAVLADENWHYAAAERVAAAPAAARAATRNVVQTWLVRALNDADIDAAAVAAAAGTNIDDNLNTLFSKLLRRDSRGAVKAALALGRPRLATLAAVPLCTTDSRILAAACVSPISAGPVNACLALLAGLPRHSDVTTRLISWQHALAAHDTYGSASHASLAASLYRYACATSAGDAPPPLPWWTGSIAVASKQQQQQQRAGMAMKSLPNFSSIEDLPTAGDELSILDTLALLATENAPIDAPFSLLLLAAAAGGGGGESRRGGLAAETAITLVLDSRAHSPDIFDTALPFVMSVLLSALASPSHTTSALADVRAARLRTATVLDDALPILAGTRVSDTASDAARALTALDQTALLDLLAPREACGARSLAARLPRVPPAVAARTARDVASELETEGLWYYAILSLQCAAGALLIGASSSSVEEEEKEEDGDMRGAEIDDKAAKRVEMIASAASAAESCLKAARAMLERHTPSSSVLCATALIGARTLGGRMWPGDAEIDVSGSNTRESSTTKRINFSSLDDTASPNGHQVDFETTTTSTPLSFIQSLDFLLAHGLPRSWILASLATRAIADASRSRQESLAIALPTLLTLSSSLNDAEAASLHAAGGAMTREVAAARCATLLSTVIAPNALLASRARARESALSRARGPEALAAAAAGEDADVAARRAAATAASSTSSNTINEDGLVVLAGLCTGRLVRSNTLPTTTFELSPMMAQPLPACWPTHAHALSLAIGAALKGSAPSSSITSPLPLWVRRARAMQSVASAAAAAAAAASSASSSISNDSSSSSSSTELDVDDLATLIAWRAAAAHAIEVAKATDVIRARTARVSTRDRAATNVPYGTPGKLLSTRRAASLNGSHRLLSLGEVPTHDEILVFIPSGVSESETHTIVISELMRIASSGDLSMSTATTATSTSTTTSAASWIAWPPNALISGSSSTHDDTVLIALIDDILERGLSIY